MKKIMIIILGVAVAACTKTLTYNQAMDSNRGLESSEIRQDAEFLVEAKSFSILLEQLSELATEMGYSAEVQTFAETIHGEHLALNDRIKRLASSNKIKVPEEMSPDHRERFEEVRGANRSEFDKRFINAVEEAYEDSIELFERQAAEASTDEVRVFAAETLGKLRTNEERADELEDDLL